MIGSYLVALALVPVLIALATRHLASNAVHDLPPSLTTALLTAYALTVSLATGLMLCLTAYLGTAELFPVVHPKDWSTDTLRDTLPMPSVTGLIVGGVAALLLLRAAIHLIKAVVSMRRTAAAAGRLPAVGDLAVVDDAAVHAYAVPGWGSNGRIVVSTGLLRTLTGAQRRALLAHEQAHLRHHHYRYAQLARLAAAANPLMRPVAVAVDNAIERWADADAVRAVGNPATVAHALGRAALAQAAKPAPVPDTALGAAQNDVVERVRDLLEPPRRRGGIAVAVVLAALMCWAGLAAAVLLAHHIVELAESATGRR